MTKMHSTQTKKWYKKPVLKKMGQVSSMTRAQKGSTSADATGRQDQILP